jgi:hypothetical protein
MRSLLLALALSSTAQAACPVNLPDPDYRDCVNRELRVADRNMNIARSFILDLVDRVEILEAENLTLMGDLDAAEATLAQLDLELMQLAVDNATQTDLADAIASIDTSTYVTATDVDDAIAAIDLSSYAQGSDLDDLDTRVSTIETDYLTSADGYASEDYVDSAASDLDLRISDIELSYASEDYVDSAASDLDLRISDIESSYASEDYVDSAASDLDLRISDLESDYATEAYVDNAINDLDIGAYVQSIDFDDLDLRVSAIESDYLESTALDGYATETWVADQGYATGGVADLGTYLSVDTSTNSVTFSGANVYVQSGSGATDGAVNGLGNLVVGYNEDDFGASRAGSHNLIVGDNHSYDSYAGVLFGFRSDVETPYGTVLGGFRHLIGGSSIYGSIVGGELNVLDDGDAATIVGGYENGEDQSGNFSVPGDNSVIIGGKNNEANGARSVAIGGERNEASSSDSMVVGGYNNIASSTEAVAMGGINTVASASLAVSIGGKGNDASARGGVVIGGQSNVVDGSEPYGIVAGGRNNDGYGHWGAIFGGDENVTDGGSEYATVVGGDTNIVYGDHSVVAGGAGNTASGSWSSVFGGNLNATTTSYEVLP